MFDIQPMELVVLGAVAILVIPPKDLPKAMRVAGYWVGRARGVARQFRSGFDAMVRESELAELQQQWAAENARIMAEHPTPAIAQLEPEPLATESVEPEPDKPDTPIMLEKPAIRGSTATDDASATVEVPKPKRKPRAKAAPTE